MMYVNNRGNFRVYGPGCSLFGCLIGLIIFSLIIRGSLYFFFRYFWLIIVLGLVIWAFRKLSNKNDKRSANHKKNTNGSKSDWHRDFENRTNTSYHNIDREFEEVDDDSDFDDF